MADPNFDALWDAAPATPSPAPQAAPQPSTGFDAAWDAAPAPGPGLLERGATAVANLVTGNDRKTAETESAPDFNMMPEMRTATVARSLPAVGSVIAPTIAGIETVVRELQKDNPSAADALSTYVGNLKTGIGTQLASPEEQAKIIVANNPDVKMRRDDKGTIFLTSAQDGKEYVVKPGIRATDVPQIAQTLATATPAAGVGGGIGARVLAGAGTQALVEGSQAATGGDFSAGDVAAAGVLNAVPAVVGKAKDAIVASNKAALESATVDAAKRAAAAAAKAEAPAATSGLAGFAEKIAQSTGANPEAVQALLDKGVERIPVVGGPVAFIRDVRRLFKSMPKKEVDAGVEAMMKGEPVPDWFANGVEAITSSTAPAEKSGLQLARMPKSEIRAAITAPIEDAPAPPMARRPQAPIKFLEPTEAAPPPPAAAPQAAPVVARASRMGDDEATALIRETAIKHGTTDAATIASKAGLSSSQVSRLLPRLTRLAMFRDEVAAAAPKAIAPAEVMPPAVAPAAEAAPVGRVPAADLVEGIAAGNTGGKVTATTMRQAAAVERQAAQAVTIGDFANYLRSLPSNQRGDFLRALRKDRGVDFARKVAKEVGMSTRGF